MSTDVKFKNPHATAYKFVDIISNSLGLSTKTKLAFAGGLAIQNKEVVRKCMLDVLKLLLSEYKK